MPKIKKKRIMYAIIIFLVVLGFQAFLIALISRVVPSEIEIFGLPFSLIFFIWGITTALLFLLLGYTGIYDKKIKKRGKK